MRIKNQNQVRGLPMLQGQEKEQMQLRMSGQ